MPRLSAPPPRVAGLATARSMDAAPTSARPLRDTAPWRAWYKTKAWQDLKLKVHIRDNYTCQRTGRLCGGRYPSPDSPVANHKKPHRGDAALFWDENNIETVTKEVHDGLIQREEQASRAHAGIWT